MRHPDSFRSLSAFAPICTTLQSPWGQKALGHYLGSDTATWLRHDAAEVRFTVYVKEGRAALKASPVKQ